MCVIAWAVVIQILTVCPYLVLHLLPAFMSRHIFDAYSCEPIMKRSADGVGLQSSYWCCSYRPLKFVLSRHYFVRLVDNDYIWLWPSHSLAWTGLSCIMQLWTQKVGEAARMRFACRQQNLSHTWRAFWWTSVGSLLLFLRQPQVNRKRVSSCPDCICKHTLLKAEAHVL